MLRSGWLLVASLLGILSSGGCASTGSNPDHAGDPAMVQESLTGVADKVFDEVKRLNATTDTKGSPIIIPHPVTGCSTRFVSIDFDGPSDLFWKNLRLTGFCHVVISGKKPAVDLVMNIHHYHEPLWHVIEDAAVQTANAGTVEITSDSVIVRFHGQFYTGAERPVPAVVTP